MQELLDLTRKIKFVHDTYWSARSGVSPEGQIKSFGNRLLGIHLRDLGFKKRGIKVLSCDAAVGDGNIDFSAVLKAALHEGCAYYVIEQKTNEPYAMIEKSFNRLNELKNSMEDKE